MECPVCYTNDATRALVCGHSFCNHCVKQWYLKSQDTESDCSCPMCRNNLYFKGMYKIVDKWEEQKQQEIKISAFDKCIEQIFEDFEEFYEEGIPETGEAVYEALQEVERRFNILLHDDDIRYDEETLIEYATNFLFEISSKEVPEYDDQSHLYNWRKCIETSKNIGGGNTLGKNKTSHRRGNSDELFTDVFYILPYVY